MRRIVLGVFLLSVVLPACASAAAASRKDCIRACSAQISACELSCVPFGGGRFGPGGSQMSRACRKAVLKTCRRQGLAVCEVDSTTTTTIPTSSSTTTSLPGGSSTTTTVTSTSSTLPSTTSSTVPVSGLAGLIGTWQFQFTIISTFTETYHLDHTELVNGVNTLIGSDQFGGLVIVNRTADLGGGSPYEFAMLDPGSIICDFYLFNRTSTTTISGEHYTSDVAFGSCDTLIGGPDPLTGTRLSTSAAALTGEAPLDETQRTALMVRERVELGAATPDETSAALVRAMGELMRQ